MSKRPERLHKRQCSFCGKSFRPDFPSRFYCSEICAGAAFCQREGIALLPSIDIALVNRTQAYQKRVASLAAARRMKHDNP